MGGCYEGYAFVCGYGCCGFFLSFREQIVENYDELFTQSAGDGGSGFNLSASFGKKWGWYQSIYGLTGGDVSRIDEITKIPLHQCLMWLAFEKDKNDLEAKMIKQSYNKNI